jgi:hypothetical protein
MKHWESQGSEVKCSQKRMALYRAYFKGRVNMRKDKILIRANAAGKVQGKHEEAEEMKLN